MSTPVGNVQYLTEMDIRFYLRDVYPEDNLLLDDLEFTSEEIRLAVTYAVDYWNEEPPPIGSYDYTNFPWRRRLLQGAVGNLLRIAAIGYNRNKLTYTIPGGSVNDQDRGPIYDRMADSLLTQYRDWVRRKKGAINVQNGWGSA